MVECSALALADCTLRNIKRKYHIILYCGIGQVLVAVKNIINKLSLQSQMIDTNNYWNYFAFMLGMVFIYLYVIIYFAGINRIASITTWQSAASLLCRIHDLITKQCMKVFVGD